MGGDVEVVSVHDRHEVQPAQVHGDDVGILAGLQGAGHVVEAQRPSPRQRGHVEDVPGIAGGGVEGAHLLEQRRELHLLEHVEVVVLLLSVGAQPHRHALLAVEADPGRARRQLHVGTGAVGDAGAGLHHQLHLPVVQPHPVGDHGLGSQNPPVVELLDRAAAELAQALLHFPDRLRRMGVDTGVELLGQGGCPSEHVRRAIEDVLEAHPSAHPAIGGHPVGLQQPAIGLQGLEVVVQVGGIGGQGGPDPDGLGDPG